MLGRANTKLSEQFSEPVRAPRWLLFLFVVLVSPLFLTVFLLIDQPTIPSPSLLAENSTYTFSNEPTPPQHGWKQLSDFDPSEAQDKTQLFSIWQSFQVNLDSDLDTEQWAVFVPVLYANFRIFVNGERIAQPAPMDRPLYINRIPRLYPVALSELKATGGIVHINAVRENASYDAYPLYVGPYQILGPAYDSHRTLRVITPILALVIIVLLTAAVGILWLLSPKHTFYGWYALTTALFACHSGWYLTGATPISPEAWSLLGRLTIFLSLTIIVFYHRYFGLHRVKTELGFAALLASAAGYMTYCAFFDYQHYLDSMNIWAVTTTIAAFYANGFLLWALARWRNVETILLAANGLAGLIVSTRDLLFQLDLAPWGYQYYMQYYSAISACVFGFLLLRRFAASMREARELNQDLERKVEEKAAELELSYAKLSKEERKRVLADERARIMRDMHDGLGGQLIHALALAEKGAKSAELSGALSLAIQDLRLIIDSLAPQDSTIDKLIASFRYRTNPMLEAANIRASWELSEDLEQEISPKIALAFLRFLQEGITNAIKHAQADEITVKIERESSNYFQIKIADNGVGFDDTQLSEGRGLNNLRIRAQEMGGKLKLISTTEGTEIHSQLNVEKLTPNVA